MILFKGILIGLLLAVPVGPVGVLCIERTLLKGKLSGIFSGLGAATADGLYAAVGAFGITMISSFLAAHETPIRLVGGLIILFLGLQSLFSKEKPHPKKHESALEKGGDYFSTLLLTLTNPSTIITFGIVFTLTGFDPNTATNLLAPSLIVAGVTIGSMLWWIILSNGVVFLSKKIPNFSLDIVKKIGGILIVVFALIILAGLRHGGI